MTRHGRQIIHAYLVAARHGPAIGQGWCLRRAYDKAGGRSGLDGEHEREQITAAQAASGVERTKAIDSALAYLELDMYGSALDYGPGAGLATQHLWSSK